MPIYCSTKVACLEPGEFERLDYQIMGHAYACQNELGRLCDESVYESDLKERLLRGGFQNVQTQVPVIVSHGDYSKTYYLDLVADNALYELKAASALTGEHEAQLLNYILLLGLKRGKLINFRGTKVQGQLLAAALTFEERRKITCVEERWQNITPQCTFLRRTLQDLLSDWGAYLDIGLYHEALVQFCGGTENVERNLPLRRNGSALGTQRMSLHTPEIAFRLTAFTEGQNHVESHLRKLLALTNLHAMQWINLNHSRVEFTTIRQYRGTGK